MGELEPDYTSLSLDDLLDVERHIDRDLAPERWARLQSAIAAHRARGSDPRAGDRGAGFLSAPAFAILHMLSSPVLLAFAFIAFPGRGPEAAEGTGMALLTVVPASFILAPASLLVYRRFLAAKRRRAFLLVSLLVTPPAIVAALVAGSSVLFALRALLSR